MEVGLAIVGLIILTYGADVLVDGASSLATRLGVSPIVVGLTIVAFGTSAPEMAVSVLGAVSGKADVAVGNVVGSNIFNVLFILGCAAIVAPLTVHHRLIRIDVPLMVGVSVLCMALAQDALFSRLDGVILFGGILVYVAHALYEARRDASQSETSEEDLADLASPAMSAGKIVVGLVLLVWGSRWFVDGSIYLATLLGVDDRVIGLTIVAAGTSLPELATSVVAAYRGQRDIAVGNVVGSNIFNILAVLGASALIAPQGVAVSAGALAIDIPAMIVVAFICFPFFFTGYRVNRLEGTVFLIAYALYTGYLVLDAMDHEATTRLARMSLMVLTPAAVVAFAHGLWESRAAPQAHHT